MRRLSLVRRNDRGAATVIIAVLLPVMLLVIGGFIVNVGSWYSARAQSQNGADAAALAVAQSCARGACTQASATTLAGTYSGNNSNGNLGTGGATTRVVCGSSPLTSCSDPSIPNNPCPAAPANAKYVNVQTITVNSVGLSGSLSGSKTKVAACAQASWGAPTSCANCVPLTISLCEWYQDTQDGHQFAQVPASGTYASGGTPATSPPSYLDTIYQRSLSSAYLESDGVTNYFADPKNNIFDPHSPVNQSAIAGSETVLLAKSAGTSGFGGSSCGGGTDGSNQTAPGQFGWLCKNNKCNGCTANITGSSFTASTGAPPAPCYDVFLGSRSAMKPIFLPVYSSSSLQGSNTVYQIAGFAAFVVTGWGNLNQSSGFSKSSCVSLVTVEDASIQGKSLTDTSCSAGSGGKGYGGKGNVSNYADYCAYDVGGNGQCIYGYFTQALISASALAGGSGGDVRGATSVSLSG